MVGGGGEGKNALDFPVAPGLLRHGRYGILEEDVLVECDYPL